MKNGILLQQIATAVFINLEKTLALLTLMCGCRKSEVTYFDGNEDKVADKIFRQDEEGKKALTLSLSAALVSTECVL